MLVVWSDEGLSDTFCCLQLIVFGFKHFPSDAVASASHFAFMPRDAVYRVMWQWLRNSINTYWRLLLSFLPRFVQFFLVERGFCIVSDWKAPIFLSAVTFCIDTELFLCQSKLCAAALYWFKMVQSFMAAIHYSWLSSLHPIYWHCKAIATYLQTLIDCVWALNWRALWHGSVVRFWQSISPFEYFLSAVAWLIHA